MRAAAPTSTPSSATWSDVAGDVEIYTVSREPQRTIAVNVMHAGRGEWGPGDRYERIRKKSYSLELVVGGSGVMDINGVRHELWPGDLVFMHPEDACVYWTGPKGVWHKLFVALHDRSLRPLVRQLRVGKVWHVRLTRAGALRAQRLLAGILRVARQAAADAPLRASVCAYELLLLLAGAAHRIEGRAHLPPQLQRALDAALAPGSAIRNVTGMARAARCPPEYFSKLFHRHMGLPPHEWLTRARMEQAADLLRTTDQPVHAVGASAGYPDPFHFSRVFRRFAGISPRGYRVQSRRLAQRA
ncbi:AraC family transcriptional regulator [bacterium]|nr:AraC family transcriptional regulator [bacterium]